MRFRLPDPVLDRSRARKLTTSAGQGQIRIQFRSEADLLALLGGAAGTGAVATAIYAHAKGWPVVIPPRAWPGGLAAAVIIGAAAGLLAASG